MSESSTNQLKKTAKHTAIYAVGTIIRRITGFVMLPIYTRYLTPSDYGVVELLTMAIEIASILIGLRISQALFRYYILAESEREKKVIVSTVMLTVVATSIVGVAVMYFASGPLSNLIFGSSEYIYELQLFTYTLVSNAVIAVGLSYIRAIQKPVLFVFIGIVSLLLQVTFNIIFVVMLELHVLGVIYSALISGFIIAIFLIIFVVKNVGIAYSKSIFRKLVRFVSPLIIASLGSFYVAYADKYYLRVFGSLADVGIYALAARVTSVLMSVFEAFNMSWAADRFEIVKMKNSNEIYDKAFRYLSALLFIIGSALAIFSIDLFWIMTSPSFYMAGYVVPILVISMILGIFKIFCNIGIHLHERTRYIAEAAWLSVIAATVGFVIFIPYFGVYGAALAMVISGLVDFSWVYRRSTFLYDMELRWKPVAMMGGASIFIVVVGLLLPSQEVTYFLFRVILFFGLILTIYFMPIWKVEERAVAKSFFYRVISFGHRGYLK